MTTMSMWRVACLTLFIFSLDLLSAVHGCNLCWAKGYTRNRWNSWAPRQKRSSYFDVLIFTQHWPQTVCFHWMEKSKTHTCSLPGNAEWSIHGIWPTEYKTLGPQYCNDALPFDPHVLDPLKRELSVKWIDIENATQPYDFWRHEWNKHGTCAAILPSLSNEFKYFKKALLLLDRYDMKDVLRKGNIVPGGAYKMDEIFEAVKEVLGTSAQIMCIKNPHTMESYLFEIRICFDKTLKLTDCDGIAGFPSNCDRFMEIIYPGTVPTSYNVIGV